MYLVCRLLPLPLFALFPYTTLFRSDSRLHSPNSRPPRVRPALVDRRRGRAGRSAAARRRPVRVRPAAVHDGAGRLLLPRPACLGARLLDRKSTRLNSSHRCISYAVFCHFLSLLSFPTRRSSDLILACILLIPGLRAFGQRWLTGGVDVPVDPPPPDDGRFVFARLRFTTGPGGYYFRGLPAWAHGY